MADRINEQQLSEVAHDSAMLRRVVNAKHPTMLKVGNENRAVVMPMPAFRRLLAEAEDAGLAREIRRRLADNKPAIPAADVAAEVRSLFRKGTRRRKRTGP